MGLHQTLIRRLRLACQTLMVSFLEMQEQAQHGCQLRVMVVSKAYYQTTKQFPEASSILVTHIR